MEIVEKFNYMGDVWKKRYLGKIYYDSNAKEKKISFKDGTTEKKGWEILTTSGVLGILKNEFPKDKNQEITNNGSNGFPSLFIKDQASENGEQVFIFDKFDGFTTYLTKFQETRKNFYASNGIPTAVATRIINENLPIFLDNKRIFKEKYQNFDFSQSERVLSFSVKDFFNDYNKYFLQDDVNRFNEIIGELNKNINLEKQKDKKENKKNFKKSKYPLFSRLKKQILGEVEKEKNLIEDDNDVLSVLSDFLKKNEAKFRQAKDIIYSLKDINIDDKESLSQIYLSGVSINTISRRWFSDWKIFESALPQKKSKSKEEKDEPKIIDFISFQDIKEAISNAGFDQSKTFKDFYYEQNVVKGEKTDFENFIGIFLYEFDNLFIDIEYKTKNKKINKLGYNTTSSKIEKFLQENKIFKKDKDNVEIIKDYSDSCLGIYRMMKYFALEKGRKRVEPDNGVGDFYKDEAGFDNYYDEFDFIRYYNAFRNYLTKKNINEDKIKLNFEKGNLLGGWDKNEETNKLGIILQKNKKYFLGIINKNSSDIFEDKYNKEKTDGIEDGKYEKMRYKFFPGTSKMIPKCSTQLKEVKKHFSTFDSTFIAERGKNLKKDAKIIRPLEITKRIFELNNFEYKKSYLEKIKGTELMFDLNNRVKADSSNITQVKLFQKDFFEIGGDEKIYKEALTDWINFCKDFLYCYESTQDFDYSKLKDAREYKYYNDFCYNVDVASYDISFEHIADNYINKKVKNGELYLFEIYNKDFSDKSTGSSNMFTEYFKRIFEEENIKNKIIKLNGQAEIFLRDKSIEKKDIEIKEKKKNHDIVKNKRYTEDQILFHFSVSLNFAKTEKGISRKLNEEVLANNKDIKIIGIDRGEKHLAYYTVINQQGDILKQDSFNVLPIKNQKGETIETKNSKDEVIKGKDYHDLLDQKEKERMEKRKSWQTITNIKELKNGYLSQVVPEICKMVIEENAIVVFEDLNFGFKRGRQKIEKQVYQNLEKALINKLNYLAFKKVPDNEAGGCLNAYQLADPFKPFKDLGKQTGVIFYTGANYTSVTDPITGFRKNIYISNSAKPENIKKEINEYFSAIGWDDKMHSYYFKYSLNEKNIKNKEWTIYADVPRLRGEKENGYWKIKLINPNDLLKDLFSEFGFKELKGDILKQIKDKNAAGELGGNRKIDGKDRNFYQALVYIINLILQIRNSETARWEEQEDGSFKKLGEDVDFIASPVEPFFATYSKYSKANFGKFLEKYKGKDKDKFSEDYNGDANGSYNIARKGIMILDRISENPKNPNLFISNCDWDEQVMKWNKGWYNIK